MTDVTFWPTIAQVSATFAALVFVALPLYLGSIHSALTEVALKYPLEENSSSLVYAAIWSNLSLFVLPLLISLSLILKLEHPQFRVAVSSLVFAGLAALLVSNVVLYRRRSTRSQLDLLRAENHGLGKYSSWRVSLGSLGVGALIIGTWLLFMLLQARAIESLAYSWLKAATLSSVFLGLGVGIFDLAVFNIDNIFFSLSEHFRQKIVDRERFLQAQMEKIEFIFTRWRHLAFDPRFLDRISQAAHARGWNREAVEGQFCESRGRIVLDYNDFISDIGRAVNAQSGCFHFVERIGSSRIITYKDLYQSTTEMDRLLEATDEFHKYLLEKYQRYQDWSEQHQS